MATLSRNRIISKDTLQQPRKLPEKLGDPGKFLIPCGFSELKCKALADLALDYSSPPLWDDYDDELFDLETVNDDTYDDPFDSKEEKIKDSKILIDELDPPRSSDFLPLFTSVTRIY
ncbi:hypothetical protein Tco_0666172 [Tanacetum coccineum]